MLKRFFCLVWLLVGLASVLQAQPAYDVVDLGSLGGDTAAYSINNRGEVTGESQLPTGEWRAYVFRDGQMTNLGASPGRPRTESGGYFINDDSIVVGVSTFMIEGRSYFCGALWLPGGRVSGPYFCGVGGGTGNAVFNGISRSAITGFYEDRSGRRQAFISDRGLTTIPNPRSGYMIGYAINNGRQVVGIVQTDGDDHAGFFYNPGSGVAIVDLGGGYSSLYAINEQGVAVGHSYTEDGELHAVRFAAGRIDDISGGVDGTIAAAVNNNGLIVGFVAGMRWEDYRAAIFPDGRVIILNSLIPTSDWTLLVAYGVNDQGEIVGMGLRRGTNRFHAYKLVPRR